MIFVPVIIEAAEELKKVTDVATSLSVAIFPRGIFDIAYFLKFLSSYIFRVKFLDNFTF